jgi:hypothetical protein
MVDVKGDKIAIACSLHQATHTFLYQVTHTFWLLLSCTYFICTSGSDNLKQFFCNLDNKGEYALKPEAYAQLASAFYCCNSTQLQ